MTDAARVVVYSHRSGLESSKVEIEVYARRFFFSWKIIKKTESKESLADLLEHSETRASTFFLVPCSPTDAVTRNDSGRTRTPRGGSSGRQARIQDQQEPRWRRQRRLTSTCSHRLSRASASRLDPRGLDIKSSRTAAAARVTPCRQCPC